MKMKMKITQLQFSTNPPSQPNSKHKPIQIKNSPPSQLNYSPSQPSSSYYRSNSSNKRLKYYSTRNKQPVAMISEENIEILKEEFMKFNDKNFRTLKESSKKDVFNLIVKKYSRKSQVENNIKSKKGSMMKGRQVNRQSLVNEGNAEKQVKEFGVGESKIEKSQNNNDFQQQFASECPENRDQNPMQHSTKFIQQNHRLYHSSPMTPTSNTRTIMIQPQRLKRHRFNKSSISHISVTQNKSSNQNKITNFMNGNNSQVSPFCLSYNVRKHLQAQPLLEQQSISCSNSARNTNTKSRRFIKLTTGQQTISHTEEEINPYTQRRYLHVEMKSEKQKMKTLEKYLQESVLETNMTKSFLVRTITPEMSQSTTCRIEKRYLTMKEDFLRKVRNFSLMSGGKKERKKVSVKNMEIDLNGWDVGNKKDDQQNYSEVIWQNGEKISLKK